MPAAASRRLLVGLPFLVFMSTLVLVFIRRPVPQEQIEIEDGENVVLMGIDDAHKRAMFHHGVWMYVVNQDGELLLLHRGAQLKTCANSLTIVGEHNRPGEADRATAVRGLHEELGLTVAPGDLRSLGSMLFSFDYENGRKDRQKTAQFWLLFDDSMLPKKGSDLLNDEESYGSQWLALSEVYSDSLENPRRYCNAYVVAKMHAAFRALCADVEGKTIGSGAEPWRTPPPKRLLTECARVNAVVADTAVEQPPP